MATVKYFGYRYRGDPLRNDLDVVFDGSHPYVSAMFNASQFDRTQISDIIHIGGDSQIVFMDSAGTFSPAGWTFANWSPDSYDAVVMPGSVGADTIAGSSQSWADFAGAIPASGIAFNGGAVSGALAIDGTNGDDTLVINATGAVSGTYSLNGAAAVAFSGLTSLTFEGGKGNDQAIVHNPDGGLFAPTNGVFIHGGTQNGDPGDGLEILGGATDRAIYTTAGHHADGKDGSIVLTHGGLTASYTYTGLEPLANTGTAADVVFNLPAGADLAFLEDDGIAFNGMVQLRSANGTFETTVFAQPTNSLTINSGAGDSITIDLANDSMFTGSVRIGSLTNSSLSPDTIKVGELGADAVTLAANGSIAELGSDAAFDISTVRLALKAGTGIGVGNTIELAPPLGFTALEAQTNTGGIFLSNTAGLQIGGVTPDLTGLRVVTSGDINIVAGGSLVLADSDGAQTVRGGSTSGDVILRGNDATADLRSTVDRDAIVAPAGGIDVRVGRDILLGTAGTGFQNDVRAGDFVFLRGERDVTVDGLSSILSDDFGLNTAGGVNVGAGRNITVASNTGDGARIGDHGVAGGVTQLFAGANGLVSLDAANSSAVFSRSGNVAINADRLAIAADSGITAAAAGHTVTIQPVSTIGWHINLGSTSDGSPGTLELSDAELDRITTALLRIGETANPGGITVGGQITANGHYQTLSLRTGGAILDGTEGEQPDITVNNLALRAGNGIGDGVVSSHVQDLDVAVLNLAFHSIEGAVNITNTGALTIAAVDGLTSSSNTGTTTSVAAASPLTVATGVTTAGQLVLETNDSAGTVDSLTMLAGVTVHSGATLFIISGDNIDIRAGSVIEAGTINFIADAHDFDPDPDPGVGATVNLNGILIGTSAGARGGNDADTFNVTPSAFTPLFLGGLAPSTLLGDRLNLNLAGALNPTLTIGSVFGNSISGQYTFGNLELVNFSEIERLNALNGALTINGTDFNDSLVVNAAGANSGSFTLNGAFAFISTFGNEDPTTVDPFGVPDTATYGQVITADATHTTLDGFAFEMDLPSTVAFRGEVYAWDGTKATGGALFESAPVSTSGAGLQVVTFNTGGITLTPGQEYVLFASTSKDQAGHSGVGGWQFFNSNVYSGGEFVFLNNDGDPSQWTTTPWNTTVGDLSFQAYFDASATVGFSGLTSLGFNSLDGQDTMTINGGLLTPTNGNGNSGSDTLSGGLGPDNLNGGAGNDTLAGGPGHDTLNGGSGNDTADYSSAGGNVQVNLATTAAQNTGAAGIDTLLAVENLVGSNFADTLTGNGLANVLNGGAGKDVLNGADGNDNLIGGDGNDQLTGGNGADSLDGSAGADTAVYSDKAAAVGVTLNGATGTTVTVGGVAEDTIRNIENVTGGSDADTLTGDSLANTLIGNARGDKLTGNGGKDTLDGGTGNDLLAGGLGNDTLTGGGGDDSYMFDTTLNAASNFDTVADFNVAADTFRLDRDVFAAIAALGTLSADAFHIGAAAADAEDRIIYNTTNDNLYYDGDGNGSAAAVAFAHVNGNPSLTNVDFVVVA